MDIKNIDFSEIDKHKKLFGSKTLNLKRCVDWGFNVPEFIPLPSNISSPLFEKKDLREKIATEIDAKLKKDRYAVRSSALIEDGAHESFAGQFLTKTNLSGEELAGGIYEVLKQANGFLKGNLSRFSIIIQEYVIPDISGITFTRNPASGREMIIEYGNCEGEKIVSGAVIPTKISFYWDSIAVPKLPPLFSANTIIDKFKDLEKKNGFPQDIEWCIKNGKFYILQTRPITTISKERYEQDILLDSLLPKNESYYLEKTEISEIAPRPTNTTLDLLKLIYSKDGPVDKVYKKYGVAYQDTDFLEIIGNELYVDKEKEIQGLLPAYSYLSGNGYEPKIKNFAKILPTIKNFFSLNKIKTSGYEKLFEQLKERIESEESSEIEPKRALDIFLKDYELIFETNLLSGLSIKKLNFILKNESVSFAQLIDGSSLFIDMAPYHIQQPKNLAGNSLDLSDESKFIGNGDEKPNLNKEVEKWWKALPEFKKKVLERSIAEAIIYNRFRELGRWLTLKNTTALRNSLLKSAKGKKFKNPKNIFFASLKSVLNKNTEEEICAKNKKNYNSFNRFQFPNIITSLPVSRKSDILGVSSGTASGILKNKEMLDRERSKSKDSILYTETLSPDLTKYFDKISGIVSNTGGLLSHLAIIAREKGIPTIVGFSISSSNIKISDKVNINGDTGKIIKI